MSSLTLLIKPSSSMCNLNCKYCFYKDCSNYRDKYNNKFMKFETLETIVIKAFSENVDCINFIFQGGEPTLIGLDFYIHLIYLQNKYNLHNIKVLNSIQTNGFLLDDDWCEFFYKNKFLVGVSLDGFKSIHDNVRVTAKNFGSFDKVYSSVSLLKKYNIEFNILSVIHKQNYSHIKDIYNFFKANNFKYIQFIPCIKGFNDTVDTFRLSTHEYYYFLDTLFELWYEDILNNNFIEIKNFFDYISVLKGYIPTCCGMGGFCSIHTVIESNGDVYPCDFYCIDDWHLGNITNFSFSQLTTNSIAKNFFDRSLNINHECKQCAYFKLCGGGCRRNLEPFENNTPSLNYQCSSLKDFFSKNLKKLIYISSFFE